MAMTAELSPREKYELVTSGLHEVLKPDILEDVILKQQRPLAIYWGTAPTGRPHCGYFAPIVHIAKFLRAGCHLKILLADIHAFLDNLKAPIDLVNHRAEYYRHIIVGMLAAIGVATDNLEFIYGRDYQLSAQYTMDVYRLASLVSEHDAKKAGAEVVKQVDNAPISGLMYPLMQALDEEHLGVDAQFGGVDQRKIFALAQDTLGRIGYRERAHLMNPMVPGLAGGKMSSSDPESKIDILDNADAVKRKIRKAFAVPREVDGNGLIGFVQYVLLPISALNDENGKSSFVVDRREEEGGPLTYHDIEEIKKDYSVDTLTPQLLKAAVSTAINQLLAPIQERFLASTEWQEIEKKAYPPPPPPEKKQKKPKNKGTRYPGSNAQPTEAVRDAEVKAITEDVAKLNVQEATPKPEVAAVTENIAKLNVQQ